ncbi:hypothetical protein Bca101_081537 [Brassica carinata]
MEEDDPKSSCDISSESCRLYFKGLIKEERTTVLTGYGVAICDKDNKLLFQMKGSLHNHNSAITDLEAELMALRRGLTEAVRLGITHISVYCDYQTIFELVMGRSVLEQDNIALLMDDVQRIRQQLASSIPVLVTEDQTKFAYKLAMETVISEISITMPPDQKMTCPICFDDDLEAHQMFSVALCCHQFCLECVKRYINVALMEGRAFGCPHFKCKSKLTLISCSNLLTPKLSDMWQQRINEEAIPVVDRVYCPNPRCSALMSETELSKSSDGSMKSCIKCDQPFCINCKVAWHSNLSCEDYKRLGPDPTENDIKLKALANQEMWRQCGKCQHMIQRSYGCNNVVCSDESSLMDLSYFRWPATERSEEGLGKRGDQWTEMLSWEPIAFVYHNFLSKEECEYLISLAIPQSQTGKSKESRVRTSSGTFSPEYNMKVKLSQFSKFMYVSNVVLDALYEQNDKPSSVLDFIQQKLGAPSVSDYKKLQSEKSDLQIKYNEVFPKHQGTLRENFYMIGWNGNGVYRVLKIERLDASELNLSEDSTAYTKKECYELLKRIHTKEARPHAASNLSLSVMASLAQEAPVDGAFKENVRPLKRGRNVCLLNHALNIQRKLIEDIDEYGRGTTEQKLCVIWRGEQDRSSPHPPERLLQEPFGSSKHKRTTVTLKKMLETAFPVLDVILKNYPPPALESLLPKVAPVAQMGITVLIVGGSGPWLHIASSMYGHEDGLPYRIRE